MVYHPRSLRILGVSQLVIGNAMFFFGILSIAIVPYWSSYTGCGLWIGLWVGLTGFFGYLGARSNSDPNKCLIRTMIGFSVTSCVLAGIMLLNYGFALSEFARRLRCPQDVYPTRHYRDYGYGECDIYNRHYYRSDYLSYSKAQAGAGLGSLLLILAVVHHIIDSTAHCTTSHHIKRGSRIFLRTQPPGTYYPQPGDVMVIPAGAAAAPGPTMQSFTTFPGQVMQSPAIITQPQQGYIVAPQGYPVQQYPGRRRSSCRRSSCRRTTASTTSTSLPEQTG